MRGSCALFYERLPRRGVFKSAPTAWACGDLHLENFGSYKADNRQVYFDINDFDEAALAPASWDLVRLLASLWVGADALGLSATDSATLAAAQLAAYADALALGRTGWVERDTADGLVRGLLDGLRQRSRPQFLDSYSQLQKPVKKRSGPHRVLRVDGKKALPASPQQRAAVTALIDRFALTQPEPGFFEVLDVARRIAGTGSLGVERYTVLVAGKGSPDDNHLLDLKAALPSSLPPVLADGAPRWDSQAQRIVALQQRLQAAPMAFLHALPLGGQTGGQATGAPTAEPTGVLRGLQPSQDRVTLDRRGQRLADIASVLCTMGRLLAWAQLRSASRQGAAGADELVDFGQRSKWRSKLLDAAQACALQVQADAHTFNQAYDDGAFNA
jgi:uncharacterized protein (DUF2252 family)